MHHDSSKASVKLHSKRVQILLERYGLLRDQSLRFVSLRLLGKSHLFLLLVQNSDSVKDTRDVFKVGGLQVRLFFVR